MAAEALNESLPNEPTMAEGIKVAIYPEYPEQTVTIGESLSEKRKIELYDLLRSKLDIFAWKPLDMTGVPRSIIEHRLNFREGCPPRLVDKAFRKQIGRNLEVYVDDLVIKSHTKQEILRDIKETFQTLRKINMKLNPKKCTFDAEEGMFLGQVINMKGAKACPDKAEAVIKLQPRTSINGQVLADFIAERSDGDGILIEILVEEMVLNPWTLFMDGSSCLEGSRARLILTSPKGVEFTYAMKFKFEASNNEAEYEALVAGLRIAEQIGVQNLEAKVESRLVANKINGSYVAKEHSMIQYLEKADMLLEVSKILN
nr:reverse transcriptase domain-containing protein [Tanacetum cinerariifolium]